MKAVRESLMNLDSYNMTESVFKVWIQELLSENKELKSEIAILKGSTNSEWVKAYGVSHITDGEVLWATGEFDRSHPPHPYLGPWEEAMLWANKSEAEAHVKEFGGRIVEFPVMENIT